MFFPWLVVHIIMTQGEKRSFESSAAVSSSLYPNQRRQSSSSAHHALASQPQNTGRSQPSAKKRVSLVCTNDHSSSQVPSSPPIFAYRQSRPQSTHLPSDDIYPEDDNVIQDREDADSLNEVVMCIDMRDRGTVGCCYYVARDQKMFVMSDVSYGGVEIVETCESS